MRIVAGAARGRRLLAPRGRDVRPTADRVKEALFASLAERLVDAHVLDLFAGSGALGLEALSRGARRVTFVERDRTVAEVLRRNVAAVGLPGAEVLVRDVARAVAEPLPGDPYDLVLLDPPYRLERGRLDRVLAALVPHLADGAVVVVERAARDAAPSWPPSLRRGPTRRYGDTAVHRARHDPAGTAGEEERGE